MTDKEIKYYVEYYNVKVAEILNTSQMRINLAFSRAIKTAGMCKRISSHVANIKISRPLASSRSEHNTKNTIVHELCHAYNKANDGHGPQWKYVAKKVGNALGFKISRTFSIKSECSAELIEQIKESKKSLKPVGLIEVPEINYKKYIYKRGRGYLAEYRGWTLRLNGHKYSLKFTKLS